MRSRTRETSVILGLGLATAAALGWSLRDEFAQNGRPPARTPEYQSGIHDAAMADAAPPARANRHANGDHGPRHGADTHTDTDPDPELTKRVALLGEALAAMAAQPEGLSAWAVRFNPMVPPRLRQDLQSEMKDGRLTAAEAATALAAIGQRGHEETAPGHRATLAAALARSGIADPEGTIAEGLVRYLARYRQDMPLPPDKTLEALRNTFAPAP